MKKRISNTTLAVMIGLLITVITTPSRIADFLNSQNETIDRFIVQDFGLYGAIGYHIIVSFVTFTVIAGIVLWIFRKSPKDSKSDSKTSEPPSSEKK